MTTSICRVFWRGHCGVAHFSLPARLFLEGTPARGTYSLLPGVLGGDTYEGHIFITARCSWRGHLRGVHIHFCLGVLGGDTCDGYIWFSLLPGGSGSGHLRTAGEFSVAGTAGVVTIHWWTIPEQLPLVVMHFGLSVVEVTIGVVMMND
ncbi:hypothetical protein Tco_1532160 [Tanacetum coccineum]